MDKKSQIRKVFSNFKCKNFYEYRGSVSFSCKYQGQCKVHKKTEPIWSPLIGDIDDKRHNVMLVAEAPSTSGGKGVHLGGLLEDRCAQKKEDSEFSKFLEFFNKELGFWPYFTDLVKCGPTRVGDKATIKRRAERCVKHFLLSEIKIIEPDFIYCIGKTSYNALKQYKLHKSSGETIKLIPLIHYSRQAGLPLTSMDKRLIWRWQLKPLTKNLPLPSLSYFQYSK